MEGIADLTGINTPQAQQALQAEIQKTVLDTISAAFARNPELAGPAETATTLPIEAISELPMMPQMPSTLPAASTRFRRTGPSVADKTAPLAPETPPMPEAPEAPEAPELPEPPGSELEIAGSYSLGTTIFGPAVATSNAD
jgi:hypothetical protein